MRPLFWLSLAVIGYTYAGYPLAMGVLARVRPRGWRRAAWPVGGERPVSIVMAVHNGAALLAGKMEHLLGLDVELVKEIVVVSDGSTDGTNGILAEVTDARVRGIVLAEQVGKAAAVNAGVRAATGEIVLFVDIRPWIEPGAVGALLANFADPSVGCVAESWCCGRDGRDSRDSRKARTGRWRR